MAVTMAHCLKIPQKSLSWTSTDTTFWPQKIPQNGKKVELKNETFLGVSNSMEGLKATKKLLLRWGSEVHRVDLQQLSISCSNKLRAQSHRHRCCAVGCSIAAAAGSSSFSKADHGNEFCLHAFIVAVTTGEWEEKYVPTHCLESNYSTKFLISVCHNYHQVSNNEGKPKFQITKVWWCIHFF